jgi:hypothetical protein
MSKTILQINLSYHCFQANLEDAFSRAAEAIASFPGLNWKIWIINDDIKTAGGLYCFADEAALSAYVNSSIIAGLQTNPVVDYVQIHAFEVIPSLTVQTRGSMALSKIPSGN